VIAAAAGRENAEQKFTAHSCIGRVARQPLLIGTINVLHLAHFSIGSAV
jgi:hypothetical protein